jgi:hypothetical protein
MFLEKRDLRFPQKFASRRRSCCNELRGDRGAGWRPLLVECLAGVSPGRYADRRTDFVLVHTVEGEGGFASNPVRARHLQGAMSSDPEPLLVSRAPAVEGGPHARERQGSGVERKKTRPYVADRSTRAHHRSIIACC